MTKKWQEKNEKDEKEKIKYKNIINKKLFSVDFISDKNRLMIETPFSFYHWKLLETIKNYIDKEKALTKKKPEETALSALTPETLRGILLIVLPNLETALHKCY